MSIFNGFKLISKTPANARYRKERHFSFFRKMPYEVSVEIAENRVKVQIDEGAATVMKLDYKLLDKSDIARLLSEKEAVHFLSSYLSIA